MRHYVVLRRTLGKYYYSTHNMHNKLHSCPLVATGDWFQDPDAEVPHMKGSSVCINHFRLYYIVHICNNVTFFSNIFYQWLVDSTDV